MPGEKQARLSATQLLAYALPVFPLSMMLGPVGSILPVFYAKHAAIGLSAVGVALMLTRILDAVADQLVGYLSDITRSRFGSRKPWLVGGTVVCVAASWAFYNPAPDAGFGYFFVSLSMLYLGWSMVSVPHMAWGAEITGEYNERAKVSSYVAVLQPLGFAVVLGVTFLPMFASSEITPAAVSMMGLITVVALPLMVGASVSLAPRGTAVAAQNPSIRDLVNAVRSNRVFWHFMAFSGLAQISLGLISATLVIYMDLYLGLGDKISLIFIVNMLVMLATVPLWLKLIYRVGKHKALAVSGILNAILIPLVLLIRPGPDSFYPLVLWMIVLGAGGGANAIAINAIMADIVDYDTLRTGSSRAGNYYAFMGLLSKAAGAVGGGAAFWVLALFGFDPKAAAQTATAIVGLKFTLVGLPLLLGLVAIWLVLRFPLDSRRHDIIRKRLEQRALRLRASQ